MGAGNPGRFAPTSWWWTQSCETGLWENSLLNREKLRECALLFRGIWKAVAENRANSEINVTALKTKNRENAFS
jgi:hypothetical protein